MAKQAKKTPAKKSPTITLLVKANPKHGKSRKRFALYRSGMSVESYVAKSVAAGNASATARADLRWDKAHGLIAVR
jgi:hypothetical protein